MSNKLGFVLTAGLLLMLSVGSPQSRTARSAASPASALMPPTKIVHHEVLPSQTDAKIKDPDFTHEAYVNADGAGEMLFMFLPGTGQRPEEFNKILLTAAEAGYHAIGVDYPDKIELPQLCGNMPGCYGPARREILDGQNESTNLDVNADNCILNRTRKLLEWLDAHYPNEHWGAVHEQRTRGLE
jgi:hypothetical protein